jgi:hypothetical protein
LWGGNDLLRVCGRRGKTQESSTGATPLRSFAMENSGFFCRGRRETSDRGTPKIRILTNSATDVLRGAAEEVSR